MHLYRQRLMDALRTETGSIELITLDPPAPLLPGRIGYQWSRWWSYPQMIQRLPDDSLLHVTDHSYGELVSHFGGASLVTVHDVIPWLMHHGAIPGARIGVLGWQLFSRALAGLARADQILAVSRSTADDLLAIHPELRSRITVIPHGVEESFFTAGQKDKPAHDGIWIGHVGNNWAYKNPLGAVTIAGQLAEQLPKPLIFLKVGDGLSAQLQDLLAKAGIAYRHIAARTSGELIAAYQKMDLLLFPSWYEGFGWPPLEAMALGVPVVVSDRGSLKEYAVPGAAHTLANPARCTSAEVNRLVALCTRSMEKNEAARRGRAWVEQFRWQRTAEATMQLYRNLV